MTTTNQQNDGFTLIELLVVIVIIGVLASVVGPRLFGRTDQARVAATHQQIDALTMALEQFNLDNGFYPTNEQGLKALVDKPTSRPEAAHWRGPYLKKREIPKDAWEHDYRYICPGRVNIEEYDLLSYGKDDREGGTGSDKDITNY